MKNVLILFIVLFIVVGGFNIYLAKSISDEKTKLEASYNDNQNLKTENTKLMDDNAVLIHQANLKSFANEKELQRFLDEDNTNITFANSNFVSEACVNLMKNAREKGYWFGLYPCNTTNENVLVAALKKTYGSYNGAWDVYSMTIVGDDSIYLIDPLYDTKWFKLMTFGADFQEYYTPKAIKSRIN